MLKLLEDLGRDIETKGATEIWKYSQNTSFAFLKYKKLITDNGDIYIDFEEGIFGDKNTLSKEDTKLNLVIKAVAEISQIQFPKSLYVSILGEYESIVSKEENIIREKITSAVLKRVEP